MAMLAAVFGVLAIVFPVVAWTFREDYERATDEQLSAHGDPRSP